MSKAADTILSCLEAKGMSQRQLAASMDEDVRYLNQQLNRQKDMKLDRFIDVLNHIGYRVEVVDNGGIRKVNPDYALEIINTGKPNGQFWLMKDDSYIGIDNTSGEIATEKFRTREQCFEWLKQKR